MNDITPTPEAVAAAFDEGIDVERGRVAAILAAFPDDPFFARAQIESGNELNAAKVAFADRLIARRDIDRECGNVAGTGHPVPVNAAPTADAPETIADPEARAQAEWNAMSPDEQKKYHSEAVYVAARRRELKAAK